MNHAWYALLVRSNHEQTAARFLSANDYDVFMPTYRELRQWSDRKKLVELPLFAGYVFCRMDIERRLPVLQAPGVVNVVGFGHTFVPVPDDEIASVRAIVESPVFARPCPYLNVGDRVKIKYGPLAGIEGILQETRNKHRLVVSVHLLQRSVSAEVSLEWVRPVNFRLPVLPIRSASCRNPGLVCSSR